MEPEGNSPGDRHGRDRRARDASGIEYDEAGAVGGEVVDDAEEPAAVFNGRSFGVLDEQELARMTTDAEVVTLPRAGDQIVLVDRGPARGHGVQEAVP